MLEILRGLFCLQACGADVSGRLPFFAFGQFLQSRSARLAARPVCAMEYPAGFLTPQL